MASTADPALDRPVRPFGWRDKVGYMFGDFGNDMTFMIQAFFMLVYFTNVIGIEAAHVGLLVMVARILDAFTDIGIGRIVDITKPRKDGKFKPWIRWFAIPVAVTSALLFQNFIADWPYALKLTWMFVFYILWGSVFYTAVNIPYGSMASVISDKAADRAELSVWRSTGAQLAFLLVSFLLPMIAFKGREVLAGPFSMSAIVMAALAVVFYALLYFNVEERVKVAPKPKGERQSGGALIKSLLTNRALMAIVVAALLLLLGNLLNGAVASYLYLDYFGSGQLQSWASLAASLPPLLLVFFIAPLVKRFGKTEVGIVGVAVYVGVMLLNFFLRPTNPTLFIVLFAIASFGLAVFNYLIWAFIVDVIDFQEVRSGERDDATVYAVYSWARKLGQALSAGVAGVALSYIGYKSAVPGQPAAQQTPETVGGIWMLFNLAPALLVGGTLLVLLFWYPLRKKQVDENAEILRQRRAASDAQIAG